MKPTYERRKTITRHFVSDRQFYGLCGATSLHDVNHALTEIRYAVNCSECRALMAQKHSAGKVLHAQA